MKHSDKQFTIGSQSVGAEPVWDQATGNGGEPAGVDGFLGKLCANPELINVVATFLTTLCVFSVFLIQGIVIAKILGPAGRGEFGTALFFPRDVFLYAGLFGGIEIVNRYAVKGLIDVRSLKYSAAKVGLITGVMTAGIAAFIAIVVMIVVGKTYLIPFCLLCCVFVPWEHMQLTISAVDRGTKNFRFYNVNRLLYAMTFLALLALVFGSNFDSLLSVSPLTIVCCLFVIARVVGILPTLRGMELKQAFLDRKKKGSSQLQPTESSSSASVDDEFDDVPSVWTLLIKGRFYALSMLASELFERLDMFLIVAIASVTESGYYFVAVPAAQLLTVAPNALGVFTFNAGADRGKRVSLRQAIAVMSGTAVLQVFSALVLALIVPYLIIWFFHERFAPAIPFALWLLPACAIKGYLQAIDGYLKGRGKPMVGVWARFLSIFAMLGFVAAVYGGVVQGPAQKLLCIPMAAFLGQAISMLIISSAVILDTMDSGDDASQVKKAEVANVLN